MKQKFSARLRRSQTSHNETSVSLGTVLLEILCEMLLQSAVGMFCCISIVSRPPSGIERMANARVYVQIHGLAVVHLADNPSAVLRRRPHIGVTDQNQQWRQDIVRSKYVFGIHSTCRTERSVVSNPKKCVVCRQLCQNVDT